MLSYEFLKMLKEYIIFLEFIYIYIYVYEFAKIFQD